MAKRTRAGTEDNAVEALLHLTIPGQEQGQRQREGQARKVDEEGAARPKSKKTRREPKKPKITAFLRTKSATASVPQIAGKNRQWCEQMGEDELRNMREKMQNKLRNAYASVADGSYDTLLKIATTIDEEMLRAIAGDQIDYGKLGTLFERRVARFGKDHTQAKRALV